MPPFVRHLAGLFIGVPGFILRVAGWVGAIIQGAWFLAIDLPEPRRLVWSAGFLTAGVLGFAMLAAFELLVVGKRYRIASRHLAPCLGLELGVQLLFSLALVCVGGGISSALNHGTWSVVILELLFIGTAVATTLLFNFLKIKRSRWELEALTDQRLLH